VLGKKKKRDEAFRRKKERKRQGERKGRRGIGLEVTKRARPSKNILARSLFDRD
jgi:hypothetical protein